jgi:DNA-binding NarL/FixJ family response regulator
VTDQDQIGVAVADDNDLMGEAVGRWLSRNPRFMFSGAFASGEDALDALRMDRGGRIAVLLLDVDVPGSDSFGALETISAEFPRVRVVMFSGHVRSEYIERALDAGAAGYIVKDEPPAVILDLIGRAARGEVVLSPAARDAMASGPQGEGRGF